MNELEEHIWWEVYDVKIFDRKELRNAVKQIKSKTPLEGIIPEIVSVVAVEGGKCLQIFSNVWRSGVFQNTGKVSDWS